MFKLNQLSARIRVLGPQILPKSLRWSQQNVQFLLCPICSNFATEVYKADGGETLEFMKDEGRCLSPVHKEHGFKWSRPLVSVFSGTCKPFYCKIHAVRRST